MKKVFALLLAGALAGSSAAAAWADGSGLDTSGFDMDYYTRFQGQGMEVNVYNWGEYISDGTDGALDVNAEFEKLTGIKVNYSNFDTNEALYAKIKSGASSYDVIFPSEFMVSRMIQEDLLQPLNHQNIPNLRHIDPQFIQREYDPGCVYSVPYTWGIVGIIYNKTMVNTPADTWDILWDPAYSGQILMMNNPSDAFGISLLRLGYSLNSTDPQQRREAADALKEQKPLVQAYVMDQIFDKMQGGEAALAPYYVGDFFTMQAVNPDLDFAIPKEGTNSFVDAVCIPKNAKNVQAAELYINFLNEPEIAAANSSYIGYSTPNAAARELLPDEIRNNPLRYPTPEIMENTTGFLALPEETNKLTDELWVGIFNSDSAVSVWAAPALILAACAAAVAAQVLKKRRRLREEAEYSADELQNF